ncbi:ATP-binding cassette domain-containing protein [Corynebacterium sp. Q4381]|uniref:ABC transporter ATP-binding protein n=1 Tax=Corynebacterium sp. Marseille-Q4381 TaxID=3121597 RepID=UPI002FE67D56
MRRCDEPAVVVDRVSKIYKASDRRFWQGSSNLDVEALKGISFAVSKGESVGVLGRNGSGKSTLMRLIAGAEQPTNGRILVSAQPTLLSVSAALRPDLTGRQNIRLGLLAQGTLPAAIPELEEDICDFAGIGSAVDRPMRTYSSGMNARLKFAIATAVDRDILLVDEALATGDIAFKSRAQQRMSEYLVTAGTIFLVSHAPTTMKDMCSRILWIHNGDLIADGASEEVADEYQRWTQCISKRDEESAAAVIEETRSGYNQPRFEFRTEVSTK